MHPASADPPGHGEDPGSDGVPARHLSPANSGGRRRYSNEEKKALIKEYVTLPRGERKAFAQQAGIEPSLLSRWHFAFYSKPISARSASDSLEPTNPGGSSARSRKGPGPNVRSVSRAAYDELAAEVAVLKGLLHIANRRGFLEHFLAIDQEEEEGKKR